MHKSRMQRIKDAAAAAPLVAALVAPLSTLLEIPALTQRWYLYYGVEVPDPTASIVLSGLGLAFNFTANVLLVVRFSPVQRRWWRLATTASTVLWVIKTIVAICNLAIFGISSRNGPGYSYNEGFWCEVSAAIFSGLISIMLSAHWWLAFGKENRDKVSTRLQGRYFMFSISFLMIVLGIQALIYSKIEAWSYFDGIYFSVVTMLTIGFGDNFVPTQTSTRVLLLPFAILTISQLANEVSIIINYFSSRQEQRRAAWRRKYERSIRELQRRRNPHATLQDEVELLEEIASKEEFVAQLYDLSWSLGSLVVFWMLGAVAFTKMQPGWTFGDSLYFQIVFCLTIGYGDFAPTEPGSKVFWVIYALLAVPLIASFAVQTVTGLLSTYSQKRIDRLRKKRARKSMESAFTQHREFILKHRKTFEEMADAEAQDTAEREEIETNGGEKRDLGLARSRSQPTQEALLADVVDAAIRMEAVSRKLLIDNLPKQSLERSILEADRNIQLRDVKNIGGNTEKLRDLWKEEARQENKEEHQSFSSVPTLAQDHAVTLSEVRRYRDSFAQLLVAAARLQNLKGEERQIFERWDSYDEVAIEKEATQESASSASSAVPSSAQVLRDGIKHKLDPRERKAEKQRLEQELHDIPEDPVPGDAEAEASQGG